MGDQGRSGFWAMLTKLKPYLAMVSLQFGFAGMYIVSTLCMNRGLSHYVLVVYRHAFATIAMAPFALIFERKSRPKMTLPVFLKIMVLGLVEPVMDQNFYYVGMNYTTASFAAAIYNVLPAVTFILAVIFRLERVKIKNVYSQAKVIGTITTISGAMLMTLYKGPVLDLIWSRGGSHHGAATAVAAKHWVTGTLMLMAGCTCWAAFLILQSFTLKAYPAELTVTTLICFMGTLEGGVLALVMERDYKNWALGWDSRLLAPVYTGIICSGIAFYVQGVVIKERGPVFTTAFNPLCMIIVAILGSLILAEQIHLGSVIGAIIIVAGLYSVVWGKSKEYSLSIQKGEALELPITTTDGSKPIKGVSNPGDEMVMPERASN